MKKELILGSQSPRRKELLKLAEIPFRVVVREIEETFPAFLPLSRIPVYLAELKAKAYEDLRKDFVVLTADTVVILENEVIGKPADEEEARRLLRRLSGKKHDVITGVCLMTQKEKVVFSEQTSVFFYELTEKQIDFYIKKYKPLDKAGAYAVQEWIGAVGVRRIEGDIYNVIGLPIARVVRQLRLLNV